MFLTHFENKNMFPEFLSQMPGEDDLGMEIAWQYVSYYIGKKKKKTIFLLSLHFVSLCYAVKEINLFSIIFNLELEGALKES